MSSIKEKLRALNALSRHHPLPIKAQDEPGTDSCADLGAQELHNLQGRCLLREKAFPADHLHSVPLNDFSLLNGSDLTLVGKNLQFKEIDPRQIIFLDTETTGLAGGTGTYAFLVGLGRFREGCFEVKQYLMRDFSDEPSLLLEVSEALKAAECLISFNGKSYDLPLLRTRFIINRLEFNPDRFAHLDLLHAVRRLWKNKVESFSLRALEAHVLGFTRQGDIPSSEIPALYFRCLDTRNLLPLKPVLQHNVIDILSMVALTVRASRVFSRPPERENLTYDVLGAIRTLEQLGLNDQAEALSENHLPLVKEATAIQLLLTDARRLKRQRRIEEAAAKWRQVIDRAPHFEPEAYIELAKSYEHRFGEYRQALEAVERLHKRIQITLELKEDVRIAELTEAVNLRRKRLLRKLAKGNPSTLHAKE
jgi:uncharacterized protein YprB with RNaseH-like and TPR domain